MGFLIGVKRTLSGDDVWRGTRGPRPNNLGAFETSYADELRDRDFWPRQYAFEPSVEWTFLERGDGPISKTFTVLPNRQNPVQIRSGKVKRSPDPHFF